MTGVLMVIKKLKIWTKDTLLFNDAILELFEGGKRLICTREMIFGKTDYWISDLFF